MSVKGIYFDFGYVIGYPKPDINRNNLYLNWDGIKNIIENAELSKYLKDGVGLKEIESFLTHEVYDVFSEHEISDLIDPRSYDILSKKLNTLFSCPITENLVDGILEAVNTMGYLEIYPEVAPILEELKGKGYILSMISNMMLPGKLLIQKLKQNNILQYFNTVTISSDIGFIKPRKEIFLKTLEMDSLKPHEVLFVGDTYSQDIIGAKSIGMKTAWLNCRQEVLNGEEAADITIKSLRELAFLIGDADSNIP